MVTYYINIYCMLNAYHKHDVNSPSVKDESVAKILMALQTLTVCKLLTKSIVLHTMEI